MASKSTPGPPKTDWRHSRASHLFAKLQRKRGAETWCPVQFRPQLNEDNVPSYDVVVKLSEFSAKCFQLKRSWAELWDGDVVSARAGRECGLMIRAMVDASPKRPRMRLSAAVCETALRLLMGEVGEKKGESEGLDDLEEEDEEEILDETNMSIENGDDEDEDNDIDEDVDEYEFEDVDPKDKKGKTPKTPIATSSNSLKTTLIRRRSTANKIESSTPKHQPDNKRHKRRNSSLPSTPALKRLKSIPTNPPKQQPIPDETYATSSTGSWAVEEGIAAFDRREEEAGTVAPLNTLLQPTSPSLSLMSLNIDGEFDTFLNTDATNFEIPVSPGMPMTVISDDSDSELAPGLMLQPTKDSRGLTIAHLTTNKSLTSTDIWTCITQLKTPPTWHIFEPGYPLSQTLRPRRLPTAANLLFTLNQRSHWTLAHVNLPSRTIEHYNSYTGIKMDLAGLKAWVAREYGSSVRVVEMVAPQQCDKTSCGVFVIAVAEALMGGKEVPMSIDAGVYRRRFAERLEDKVPEVPLVDHRGGELKKAMPPPVRQRTLTSQLFSPSDSPWRRSSRTSLRSQPHDSSELIDDLFQKFSSIKTQVEQTSNDLQKTERQLSENAETLPLRTTDLAETQTQRDQLAKRIENLTLTIDTLEKLRDTMRESMPKNAESEAASSAVEANYALQIAETRGKRVALSEDLGGVEKKIVKLGKEIRERETRAERLATTKADVTAKNGIAVGELSAFLKGWSDAVEKWGVTGMQIDDMAAAQEEE